jgi:hypothetical protein
MIDQRGDEDPGDDGPGLAVTRGQHQRQQLRLVAELAYGDHGSGYEQSFEHGRRLCYCHNSRTAATIRLGKAIILAFSRNLTGSAATQELLYLGT